MMVQTGKQVHRRCLSQKPVAPEHLSDPTILILTIMMFLPGNRQSQRRCWDFAPQIRRKPRQVRWQCYDNIWWSPWSCDHVSKRRWRTILNQVFLWEGNRVIIIISGWPLTGSIVNLNIIVNIIINISVIIIINISVVLKSNFEMDSQVSLAEPGSAPVQQQFENGDVVVILNITM